MDEFYFGLYRNEDNLNLMKKLNYFYVVYKLIPNSDLKLMF